MPIRKTNAATAAAAPSETESHLNSTELRGRVRRGRAARDLPADRARAIDAVVLQLRPLLDDLERALAELPEDLVTHPWAQGIALTHRQLVEARPRLGDELIGADGEPFDPAQREALLYEARPEARDRRILKVVRPGYRRGAHAIRPAHGSLVGPAESRAKASGDRRTTEVVDLARVHDPSREISPRGGGVA